MTKLMKYRVVREHQGDKPYAERDERIAAPSDVKHLIPHVLEEIGPADDEADEKAEAPHPNKSEGDAPTNKSLDHDGDGKAGGSLSGEESTRSKGAARKTKGE